MRVLSRAIGVPAFLLFLILVPATAQTPSATASKEVQAYEKYTKNKPPASDSDVRVPQNATGFAAKWAGQPMYKMMIWCAAEIDAATPDDMNSRTAFAIMSDAIALRNDAPALTYRRPTQP